jgi:hypothetical protein
MTTTAGVIATPATALEGWTVKASWVAVDAMMSNAALVVPLSQPVVAVRV